MDEKTLHITLHIANVAPLDLDIPPEMEPLMNRCAEGVNYMWSSLSTQYPDKRSADIIAMVAMRYAQAYYTLMEERHRNQKMVEGALKQVNDILLGIE